MKYRIKEIKLAHEQPRYYPQYKEGFWFWNDIAHHYFAETIFNKNDGFHEVNPYVYSLPEAQEIIDNFKRYTENHVEYEKIHEVPPE